MLKLPDYASRSERIWHYAFIAICAGVFVFLIAPLIVIIPLSFNSLPYFTFTEEMLALEKGAFSLRWYEDFWSREIWRQSIVNSLLIAVCATVLATALGTVAALGLSRPHMPFRAFIMGLLISPMIVPVVITAAGIFFFYARIGLTGTYLGIILAHTALGTPFVVITVTATLIGFDHSMTRAAAMCGADPARVFFKIVMPLILPGVIAGALFAFVTSFDEVVVVLFVASVEQQTIPRQMWAGIREEISPTILAVATLLIVFSVAVMTTIELLRRRSERLRGVTPA